MFSQSIIPKIIRPCCLTQILFQLRILNLVYNKLWVWTQLTTRYGCFKSSSSFTYGLSALDKIQSHDFLISANINQIKQLTMYSSKGWTVIFQQWMSFKRLSDATTSNWNFDQRLSSQIWIHEKYIIGKWKSIIIHGFMYPIIYN